MGDLNYVRKISYLHARSCKLGLTATAVRTNASNGILNTIETVASSVRTLHGGDKISTASLITHLGFYGFATPNLRWRLW